MVIKDWQKEHFSVISDFLKELNKITSDFVLKGGTSLMMCYNLDRFSEDIDLDGKRNNKNISKIIDEFCKKNNYSYNINKNTDTVKRFMIHYSENNKPLKVEISFRQKNIRSDNLTNINNIAVYNINSLCRMKASAYQSRDKIRDLYDVCFICNNYWDELSAETVDILRNAVEYKGIEQFDYILREQSDELIDNDKLTEDFLSMYDKLDLLYTEEEKDIVSSKLRTESILFERMNNIYVVFFNNNKIDNNVHRDFIKQYGELPHNLDTAENRAIVSEYINTQLKSVNITETQRECLESLRQAIRDFEESLFIQEVEKIAEWCEEAQKKAVERMTELDEQNKNKFER